MKCIILAAGYATRLYPLTENFPKPLLKVLDKTIIDWLIDDLTETGKIDEFIVISNHKFIDHFNEWKKNKESKVPISIIDDGTTSNETRLGAVVDINLVIDKFGINEDVMVIAGDNVLDFSLRRFIDFFYDKMKTCVMYYYEPNTETMKKRSCLVVDDNNKVINMVEKPAVPISNYCCPPFYIYSKDDLSKIKSFIEEGNNSDAPGSFISYLYDKTDVYAYLMPGNRYDIGTIESYEFVNKVYKGIE